MIRTIAMTILAASAIAAAGEASFADVDRRARAGEPIAVAFFGGSLTWGANATDPQRTSYRAKVAQRLEAEYPKARITAVDAAIGGTGSELGIHRLDRDVLAYKPDLVFLDFTANDGGAASHDEWALPTYEAIIRRLVGAGIPVVIVLFPFQWDVENLELEALPLRKKHMAIAAAYGLPVGDAIARIKRRVTAGETTYKALWDLDQAHPGDAGYAEFAEAAWAGWRDGVDAKRIGAAPATMLHGDTAMRSARVRLSKLGALPKGWQEGMPNRTAAWYDGLTSRWLDDVVIARQADGGAKPLRFLVSGDRIVLFGEETTSSGKYRVFIDGVGAAEKDCSGLRFGGNRQHAEVIARGLDPKVKHLVEIHPALGEGQELRLESICVSGGEATVELAP